MVVTRFFITDAKLIQFWKKNKHLFLAIETRNVSVIGDLEVTSKTWMTGQPEEKWHQIKTRPLEYLNLNNTAVVSYKRNDCRLKKRKFCADLKNNLL